MECIIFGHACRMCVHHGEHDSIQGEVEKHKKHMPPFSSAQFFEGLVLGLIRTRNTAAISKPVERYKGK